MNRIIKHIISTGLFITVPVLMAAAQDPAAAPAAEGATAPGVPELFFNPSFYIVAFIFIIMFAVIVSLTRSIKMLASGLLPADRRAAMSAEGTQSGAHVEEESFWAHFDRKVLTKAVPVEKEADVMLDHNYDGIRELDNALPPWWVWGFYLTIIFSVVYLLHFHVMKTGPSQEQEYKNELAIAEQQQKERASKNAGMITAETAQLLNTPEALGEGKELFTKNCVACHGPEGGGTVGPNLTDEFWLHGGGIKNVFKTVTEGVPAKGMISWKAQLSPKQIQSVSSYVLSLQGTKPAGGKEPQGDKWVEEGAAAAVADSAAVPADSVTKGADVVVK